MIKADIQYFVYLTVVSVQTFNVPTCINFVRILDGKQPVIHSIRYQAVVQP
jgi:hypothetical protein